MQRRKTGKISIFSSLDIIFDFLTSWVENSNQVLTWNRYQIESECWNQVFKLSQKIDIEYLSRVRRLISKLNLMISLEKTWMNKINLVIDMQIDFFRFSNFNSTSQKSIALFSSNKSIMKQKSLTFTHILKRSFTFVTSQFSQKSLSFSQKKSSI